MKHVITGIFVNVWEAGVSLSTGLSRGNKLDRNLHMT